MACRQVAIVAIPSGKNRISGSYFRIVLYPILGSFCTLFWDREFCK